MSQVIVVIGEALVDLVADGRGVFAARPGGGPYNVARALARLGAPAVFAGRLSGDGFGRMLRDRLEADGVRLGIPEPSELPTTLAVADIDEGGSARYSFYLEKTSAADVRYDDLVSALVIPPTPAVPPTPAAPATPPTAPETPATSKTPETPAAPVAVVLNGGALGFVMDPLASSVERIVAEALPPDTLLMVDPNCRPMTITDRDGYVARLGRIFRRADIVKASVEDLAYLFPGLPADKAASALLEQGAGLVLVTDGARLSRGFLADGGEVGVDVPAVDVVDTIGAGDAFGGGFLASWIDASRTQAELRSPAPDTADAVRESLSVAVKVAAITCSRPGADPPSAGELASVKD